MPGRFSTRSTVAAVACYWLALFVAVLAPFSLFGSRQVFLAAFVLSGLPLLAWAALSIWRLSRSNITEMAYRDELTMVGNRRAFMQAALERLRRSKPGKLALILLDVDGLKAINDVCGHQAGDELLVTVGARLRATGAAAYRIGGDEFAMLIDRGQGEAAAPILRGFDPFRVTFATCGHEHEIRLSYGYASGEAGETLDGLVQRADARLREFKRRLYESTADGAGDDAPPSPAQTLGPVSSRDPRPSGPAPQRLRAL